MGNKHEDLAREISHSIAPCDFGSTEAIKLFAKALRQVAIETHEKDAEICANWEYARSAEKLILEAAKKLRVRE